MYIYIYIHTCKYTDTIQTCMHASKCLFLKASAAPAVFTASMIQYELIYKQHTYICSRQSTPSESMYE